MASTAAAGLRLCPMAEEPPGWATATSPTSVADNSTMSCATAASSPARMPAAAAELGDAPARGVPRHDRLREVQLAGHLRDQVCRCISGGCERADRTAQLHGEPVTQQPLDTGDRVVDGHETGGALRTERRDGAVLQQGAA